jgi:hypothetical protein
MRLILAYGGGSGYYPYTQKPVDYQPYRPVYLFRGPPPDAGFSYGLFEDEDVNKKYYSELGIEPFSPFTGKKAKFLEEVTPDTLKSALGKELDKLEDVHCAHCGADYKQNLREGNKDKELWCHKCGAKINMALIEHPKMEDPEPGEAEAASTQISKDPKIQNFVKQGMQVIMKSPEMKELIERIALEKNLNTIEAKKAVLLAFREAMLKG